MADTYIAELEAQLETERLRLAACTAAVTYNTEATREPRLTPDHPFYSATYKDVCDAVDREMALRKELEDVEREYASFREHHAGTEQAYAALKSTHEALVQQITSLINDVLAMLAK